MKIKWKSTMHIHNHLSIISSVLLSLFITKKSFNFQAWFHQIYINSFWSIGHLPEYIGKNWTIWRFFIVRINFFMFVDFGYILYGLLQVLCLPLKLITSFNHMHVTFGFWSNVFIWLPRPSKCVLNMQVSNAIQNVLQLKIIKRWKLLYEFLRTVGESYNMLTVSSEKVFPGFGTKLNLVVRLQFWSSGKFVVPIYC